MPPIGFVKMSFWFFQYYKTNENQVHTSQLLSLYNWGNQSWFNIWTTFSNEHSIQKFKAKRYDLTLGQAFPTCLTTVASNAFVMLSTKHFELALNFHFVPSAHNLGCRNPTLAKCGGEAQHLEKVRIWSPPGLPNVQSSTTRPKTPHIGMFLVSLERS